MLVRHFRPFIFNLEHFRLINDDKYDSGERTWDWLYAAMPSGVSPRDETKDRKPEVTGAQKTAPGRVWRARC